MRTREELEFVADDDLTADELARRDADNACLLYTSDAADE